MSYSRFFKAFKSLKIKYFYRNSLKIRHLPASPVSILVFQPQTVGHLGFVKRDQARTVLNFGSAFEFQFIHTQPQV